MGFGHRVHRDRPSASGRVVSSRLPAEPARPIATISAAPAKAVPTGVSELDRVLGGGLVPGAVVLLAGEPGVGKSTLLLDVAQQWAARPAPRRSWSAARSRSARCGCGPSGSAPCTSGCFWRPRAISPRCSATSTRCKPGLLVLDSVQTISTPGTEGVPGGVTQVRAVTAALVGVAKERGMATVLVGHVTKDGPVAGPRVLEHLVDVVLHFEGDKHSSLRLVRGVKNRFGAADEVGCFEMHEGGITSLADPSGLFLTRYAEPVPGHLRDGRDGGRRALVTEVQALIGAEVQGSPRRTVSGLDSARLAMVLAVLERRTKQLKLYNKEVFAATVGGIRLVEPSADLAMALAVASGGLDLAMAPHLVAIGEVGLTGEIRRVGAVAAGWPRRPGSASGRAGAARLRPGRRPRPGGHAGGRGGRSPLGAAGGRHGLRRAVTE